MPEFQRLNEKMVNWHLSREAHLKGELENEIEYNLVSDNRGYFEYARNVFMKQYNHLGERYPEWLKEYIADEIKVQEHAEAISEDGADIKWDDFIVLYIIRCIQHFRWIEREYALAYESYIPLIELDRELPLLPWFYIEPIYLNYGSRNDEVMELMYSMLNGRYFNMPESEFYAHFSDTVPRQPIKWGGKLMTLLPLFMGQDVPINDKWDFETVKIKIHNSITQMVFDHFSDANGNRFKKTSISTLIAPNADKPDGNLSSPVSKVLKEIFVRFN